MLSAGAWIAFADGQYQHVIIAIFALPMSFIALKWQFKFWAAARRETPPMTAGERKRHKNNMRMFGIYQRGQIYKKLDDIEDKTDSNE